jgi:hypothetical protein
MEFCEIHVFQKNPSNVESIHNSLTKLLPHFWTAKVKVLQVIEHTVIPLIRRSTHVLSVNK